MTNGWRNDNTSGFEKKVEALAGIEEWKRNNLCHFVVEPFDEQYVLNFKKAGVAAFVVEEKFDLLEDAREAAGALITAMSDSNNYRPAYLPEIKKYQLLLHYGGSTPAAYPDLFANSNDADSLANFLSAGISQKPGPDAVFEYSWIWIAELKDSKGNIKKTATEIWHNEEEAKSGLQALASTINDAGKWKAGSKEDFDLELVHDKQEGYRFIDIGAFNIDPNDTIIGKPGRFDYDVLDRATNSFRLSPVSDFNSKTEARDHCCTVLAALLNDANMIPSLDTTNEPV